MNRAFLIGLLLFLCGCSSSINPSIRIGEVRFPNAEPLPAEVRARVAIGQFSDSRVEKTLAAIDNEYLFAAEDLGKVVQRAVERRIYGNEGFPVTMGSITISGDLTQLRAQGHGSFPVSHLRSEATIQVSIANPDGSIVHRAAYTGEVEEQLPLVTSSSVGGILRMAIAAAVNEMIADPTVRQLMRQVSVR